MKKGACVDANNAGAPLQPRTDTNEVKTMKPRIAPQPQPADRLLIEARAWLAADPAYAPWSEARHASEAMRFDAWLDTMAGKAWLDQQEAEAEMKWLEAEAEADEERHCLTAWEGW